MESTLAGIGVSPIRDAVSVAPVSVAPVSVASVSLASATLIAVPVGASARSGANPVRNSDTRIPAARIRTAHVVDTSFQGGVGSYDVQGPWRFELPMTDPMSTHKFTTRQGPPTCSPPA